MVRSDKVGARTVLLLRHAKSSWDDPSLDDHERPLNARGVRAARLVARHLATEDVSVDLVLCSTAVRARQTLDHILGSVGRPEVRIEAGIYHADAMALWTRLREVHDLVTSVLMVGHNPTIQQLAVLLAGDGDEAALEQMHQKFPTAALATIDLEAKSWGALEQAGGRLRSFTVPSSLEGS